MMKKLPFSFFDILVDGVDVWFVHNTLPVLIHGNITSDVYHIETVLPLAWGNGFAAYGCVKRYLNTIIIAPKSTPWLLLYDIETKNIEKIEVDYKCMVGLGTYNLFDKMYIVDKHAYLIPGRYPSIVKLDLETRQLEYIEVCSSSWLESLNRNKFLFYNSILLDRHIYAPCYQTGDMMKFSIDSEDYELMPYINGASLIAVAESKRGLICACKNKTLMVGKDTIKLPSDFDSNINFLVVYGDNVYVIPINGKAIFYYNMVQCKWTELVKLHKEYNALSRKNREYGADFWSVHCANNSIFLSSNHEGTLMVIDMISNEVISKTLELPLDDLNMLFQSEPADIVNETRQNSLQNYIKKIAYFAELRRYVFEGED
ncbi:MAG: hypothetical protein MJ123_01050 [Lachnospiraceae bacterium]|nr:hypothetical protein [Lachnospiraceae bacterium]